MLCRHGFARHGPNGTNPHFELLSLPFSVFPGLSGFVVPKNRWPHHADPGGARYGDDVSGAADVADAASPFPVISSGTSGAADRCRASVEPWPADCVPLNG